MYMSAKEGEKDMYTENNLRAAIYCRLSKDDEKVGESESIQNQRTMLEQYCEQQNFEVVAVYQDDGYTGLNMNRPDFNRMLKAIERKQIDIVITKDLSRFSRDYIEMGRFIEEYFPKNSIRYIAVNDNVDTIHDNNEIIPFRNLLNQMYSQDVSKKVHSSYLTKAKAGLFTGCIAPFGYMKNPQNKNHLIIDEDTSWIIELIYDYAFDGNGPNYIRRKLEDKQIPCPAWWNRKKGLRNKVTKFEREDPEKGRFIWDFTTIKEILYNPVYIGSIASQKQVYKFKTGWIKDKKPDEWILVENMHEPIISKEMFEQVQEKVKMRKRPDAFGNYSIFAGLVKCGECGYSMNIRRANQKGKTKIYTCAKYNKFGVSHCSQHRIKYDVLYNLVLEQIRGYAYRAFENEEEVISTLNARSQKDFEYERTFITKAITQDKNRLINLNKLSDKLYNDLLDDRISTENFNIVMEKSQTEIKYINSHIEYNQSKLTTQSKEQEDNSHWLELIKEYADIKELDVTILHKLIKKIVIYENMDENVIRQTVEIHFNFINQADKYKLIRE